MTWPDDGEEPVDAAVREGKMREWKRRPVTGWPGGRVEPLITFQPMVSTVDSEQFAYLGGTRSVSVSRPRLTSRSRGWNGCRSAQCLLEGQL